MENLGNNKNENTENLENSNNLKRKISYIFKRTFVGIGEAPLFRIALLQLINMFALAILIFCIIKFINTPRNIENADIISGKFADYWYISDRKFNKTDRYCVIKIIYEKGKIAKFESDVCNDNDYKQFDYLKGHNVTIWYNKDLFHTGRIYIHQLKVDDLPKFSNIKEYPVVFKTNKRFLKGIFYSGLIFLFCHILIYILNTDEVQEKFRQKQENKKREQKDKVLKSKLNLINVKNKLKDKEK